MRLRSGKILFKFNANATEFTPKFALNANAKEFTPADPVDPVYLNKKTGQHICLLANVKNANKMQDIQKILKNIEQEFHDFYDNQRKEKGQYI